MTWNNDLRGQTPMTMRLTLLFAAALYMSAAAAQPELPATTRADLSVLQGLAQQQPDPLKLTHAVQGRFPAALMNGRCMVGFLGKVNATFAPANVDHSVVHIGTHIGEILSFRVDAHRLDALNAIPGLAYAELAGIAGPHLDKVVPSIHADSVQQGINLPQPYTGDGVLIGVLDWGFDYTHPMFYDTALGQTRVRAAWDQFRQGGTPPAAFGYGAEFATTDDLLTAESDTANIYGYALHGTHVAGIVGGGGAGTAYRGIAFDAQYLFCTFLVDAAAAIDGVAWMQQKAQEDGKRLVVNMSWGLYHMGTLDGNSLLSQAYDSFSDQGVVLVTSAGNNGNVNFHIGHDFTDDTLRSLVQFYPYSAHPHMWGQSLTLWGEPDHPVSTSFQVLDGMLHPVMETPWYHSNEQTTYVDSFLVANDDTVFFNLSTDAAHPLNGRPHFRMRIKNTNTALRVVMQVTAESGTVHCWNVTELDNDVGNWGQAFQGGQAGWTAGDHFYGIGEPACTESMVTVAACSSTTWTSSGLPLGGGIAGFSSFGPTLDGRIKPDITAPGVSVVSSISSFTDNDYTPALNVPFQGRDYPFARLSGTSMSSPAATGVVALLLQANPDLAPADVRAIIRETALSDNNTGEIPAAGSTRWGMGKLNAYHAITDALGVTAVNALGAAGISVWPNPARDQFFIKLPHQAAGAHITVTDALGKTVETRNSIATGVITMDASAWPPGLYVIRLAHGMETLRIKVVRK